ncbi:ABC transporter permease [Kribbella speibonae]|uniref:Transport permease protein n=1 Tax=Kribbella speibonae TaxID=1572660 RepID=A0ABY2AF02_9ACTN|nr:ABC transporter permease [Kribbella speibonae]TCC26891.1 ABC transporter permease [Kribbella speibonae]
MTTTIQKTAGSTPPLTIHRPNAVSTSRTMAYRAVLRIRRAPEQLADALMIPVIFTLLFTYLFGGALAGSTSSYLQELLPGTLVMSVILVTTFIGTGLNTDLTRGRLDRFRAMPIWQPSLIVGGLIGDLARYLMTSGIVIGLGLIMGFRPAGGATGVVLGVALILAFATGLSWIWTTLGLLARSPQSLGVLSFLVQFPLLFASNTFVAPDTMPNWLDRLVTLNPVSHLVSTERHLMAGTATAGEVTGVLLAAAALTAVFAPLTMRLYRRRS